MGLLPLEMVARARADDLDGASDYGLRDCILCGCCSYVCPSHIPLVQYFQYAMGKQDERRSAERKTEHIKRLTEARAERQAQEAAAKEAAKEAAKAAKAAAKVKPADQPTSEVQS
ncbi:Electron transport complex protein RnfC [compost metagenome]